jgi:hypothetical protein
MGREDRDVGQEIQQVMAVVQTAMLAGLPYTQLREAVLTHPTMAEGLGFLRSLYERHGVNFRLENKAVAIDGRLATIPRFFA